MEYTGYKPKNISPSQIMLGECLYKYMRMRLKKDIIVDKKAMNIGSAVHDIIYQYTKWCIENKTESDFEEMERIVDDVFEKYKFDENEYQDIRNIAIVFGERGVDFDKIYDVEKREEINLGIDMFGKPILIQIVIDRINSYRADMGTVLEIIDYKNQMNILTKHEVDNHIQLQIYKYLACNYLYKGFDFVRVGIWHTRHNFCRWGEMKPVKECSDEFENMNKFLLRQWDRLINSKIYEPKRCNACWEYGGCEIMLRGECLLYKKKEINKLMKSKDIEDRVNAYKKLDIDLKILKKSIMEYFKNNPLRIINGKEVGYSPTISYKYILTKAIEYAKKYNISLEGLTLSKTDFEKAIEKVKKISKMKEEELKELKTLQDETGTNTFKI